MMSSAASSYKKALLTAFLTADRAPRNHRNDVHILSCGLLLIFLAFGAAQNLQSTINTTDNLGTISLGVLYVSFTIFSVVASLVVRWLGSRNALLLGTSGYWLFILANFCPSWYTMISASLYLGFSASILWVGQGTYLASTAWSHAKDSNLPDGIVFGSFNGEFWGFICCHQIFGNLISLAVLQDNEGGNTGGTMLLFIMFLCSMILGTILLWFLQERDDEQGSSCMNSSVGFYSNMKSRAKFMIRPLLDSRMLLLVPLLIYVGLQQAFVWAEFTKDVIKPAFGIHGVGGAMAIYGAFGALASLAAGRATSDFTSITSVISGGVLLQSCIFIALLVKDSFTGTFASVFPFILALLLGMGDGVLHTQVNALLGVLFKEKMEATFALSKGFQNLAIAGVFFASPYIPFQAMMITMLAVAGVSISAFLFLATQLDKAFSCSALDG